MKKITNLIKRVNTPYRDLPVRVLISLFAAHFILSHTTEYGFFEVATVNGYIPSLIASFIIALIIVYTVFKTTVILDKKVPYATNWKKRCVYQVLLGVIGVSALAAGLAFLLFYAIKEPERIWRYFNQDFTIILAFIIGVNAYYFIRYLTRVIRRLVTHMLIWLKRARREEVKRHTDDFEEIQTQSVEKQLGLVYIHAHRRYRAFFTDGTQAQWFTTLEDTIKELPPDDYFLINRKCIVRKDVIRCIKKYPSKRYLIVLKIQFTEEMPEELLVVSQPNGAKFVRWIGDRNLWV